MPAILAYARAGLGDDLAAADPGVAVADAVPVIAAHSRGGKLSWRVLLANAQAARGLALIDPVDAPPPSNSGITDPNAVTGALAFTGPAVIVGTGKGPDGFQPCAPAADGHARFADALSAAVHVVETNAGHNDLLNSPGFVCANGPTATQTVFRVLAGGLIAATVREALGEPGAIAAAVASAPAGVTLTSP
jgi:pimeloyl-ACP methyl ester carboxylesterase